jgi:hypothetical protein
MLRGSPPRTIADIARLLDNERPDAAAVAKLRSAADAKELDSSDRAKLAHFFYDRSQARMLLGEFESALSDAKEAIEVGQQTASASELTRYMQVSLQYAYMGDASASDPAKAFVPSCPPIFSRTSTAKGKSNASTSSYLRCLSI